jgi:DNA-binding transcriptional regulator YdaS (Cro superfamily)
MTAAFSCSKHFKKSRQSLLRAIRLCSTQKKLAKICGVTQQAVNDWLKRGIPAHRALTVERAVSGAVTRHELRPDIYPEE